MTRTALIASVLALCLTATPCRADALDAPETPTHDSPLAAPIIVFGHGATKIGTAQPASEGGIGGTDLLVRPLLRVAELRFVGNSNAVKPSGTSRRYGYDATAFWRVFRWLALDGNYTASHARHDNGDHIPNAFDSAASGGMAVILAQWKASVRMRHLGPSSLTEDNSIRDQRSTVVNTRAAWAGKRIELYGEVLDLLASKDKDIPDYYECYVPAVDGDGPVEGRLSRVVEPRPLRLGAKDTF